MAEGLHRLSYKSRSKLEIEFLSRLYEAEEEDERHKEAKNVIKRHIKKTDFYIRMIMQCVAYPTFSAVFGF